MMASLNSKSRNYIAHKLEPASLRLCESWRGDEKALDSELSGEKDVGLRGPELTGRGPSPRGRRKSRASPSPALPRPANRAMSWRGETRDAERETPNERRRTRDAMTLS